MSNHKSFAVTTVVLLALSVFLIQTALGAAEEPAGSSASLPAPGGEATNAPTRIEPPIESTNAASTALHLEQLQEQQRVLLRAIEQIRQEASAISRQNAESITSRLALIEQSLAGERQRELEAIQKWNLLTLLVVGGFASVGFLALLLVAPFLVRALNRMSDAAATLRVHQTARLALPESTDTALLASPVVNQSTARFLEAVDRVEKRIRQLEQTVQAPNLSAEPHSNGGAKAAGAPRDVLLDRVEMGVPGATPHSRVELVLEKGKALLLMGETERALASLDEAMALEPDNPEVHIKRGQAFEKLKRSDEALASYDRAIGLDKSLTTAYLCKGSLLNQMARYDEALRCYELALQVQEA